MKIFNIINQINIYALYELLTAINHENYKHVLITSDLKHNYVINTCRTMKLVYILSKKF